ncbi:cytochrome C [bacterium SCSIO 12741]|nr:cytochrome C [bacterium SCSIO 12741]
MKKRLFFIGLFTLVMLGSILVFFSALQQEMEDVHETPLETVLTPSLQADRDVFSISEKALEYKNMPDGDRSLKDNYAHRAYPGAPPIIPHAVFSENEVGGKTCLQCHKNGGYTPEFEAYAPIAPHPNFTNCRQCHVPKTTDGEFKPTEWEKTEFPELHQAALPGAPPPIPHTLQLRGNCLSCHAGSAAPVEIRTTHPERINCRQCHVAGESSMEFSRPDAMNAPVIRDTMSEQGLKERKELIQWLADKEQKTSNE